ncbi:MAG: choice-of-anchor B family protein, partial [Gemmatimonadota bacterium]
KDLWGWTDPSNGREYVLVGRTDGLTFLSLANPNNPKVVGHLPSAGGSNLWRDVKVYRDHAYVVADGVPAHGMQVFDLKRLRNASEFETFTEDARYANVGSVHNLAINEETGFAYATGGGGVGISCGGGLHMIDLSAPKNPTFAGCFADPSTGLRGTGYTHDVQCVVYTGPDADHAGREICLGANETALSIADVTDKSAPVSLAMATYPTVAYAHQGWLTEDQRYFLMNDELDELQGLTAMSRMLVWDVADLDDPILVTEYLGPVEATDHNVYVRGSVAYQSNYHFGLRIIDVSVPTQPRELGFFDTFPNDDAIGFGGSWSNYPFFGSGLIAVTSSDEGLFILKRAG